MSLKVETFPGTEDLAMCQLASILWIFTNGCSEHQKNPAELSSLLTFLLTW